MNSQASTAASPAVKVSAWVSGYMLVMLLIVNVFNTIDRQLVAILLQPIKEELGASDTQMGLLTGFYYSLFQVVAAIPLARLADMGNRRALIAACIAIWSAATMASGFVMNYAQIAAARTIVAIGEGGSQPAAHSMLSDVFPPRMRARVFGILAGGGAIGMAFGIFLGGTLGDLLGWRNVFIVIGAPGILVGLLMLFTVKEPARQVVTEKSSFFKAFGELWRTPTYRLLMFINLMGGASVLGLLSWTPAFLARVHGMSGTEVGIKLGLASFVGLLGGNLSAGFVADYFARRNPSALVYTAAGGLLMVPPLGLLMAFHPSDTVALFAYAFLMYFNAFMPPANAASAVGVALPRSRAVAVAAAGLFTTIGGALGPFVIGFMNDQLLATQGVGAIRFSIASIMVFPLVGGLAGVIFGGLMKKDYKSLDVAG